MIDAIAARGGSKAEWFTRWAPAVLWRIPICREEIAADYNEARSIVAISPRGTCALLRLGVQKLCAALGEPGENINTDIASLVKRGLLPQVQQALDSLRVIGNSAVHPGKIDLKDDQATALRLFEAMNLIVEQMISGPKHAAALYASLPASDRERIEQRDGVTAGP